MASSIPNKHANSDTETAPVQENRPPSLRKDSGRLLCRTCHKGAEYSSSRRRVVLYTEVEEGPTARTRTLAVSHCPEHGHYSTVYDDDIIAYKHYALPEIQGVLDGSDSTSLACRRTHYNWRKWYEGIRRAVVDKIWRHIGGVLSKAAVCEALWANCRSLGDGWLRYVLDLFWANVEDLCTYILLAWTIMAIGGEGGHQDRVLHGVPGPREGRRPP